MNRKQSANLVGSTRPQARFNFSRIKIERGRINIHENWSRSGTYNRTGRSEKTESAGDHATARLNSRRDQCQPKRIGPRRATHRRGNADELRHLTLKLLDFSPKN